MRSWWRWCSGIFQRRVTSTSFSPPHSLPIPSAPLLLPASFLFPSDPIFSISSLSILFYPRLPVFLLPSQAQLLVEDGNAGHITFNLPSHSFMNFGPLFLEIEEKVLPMEGMPKDFGVNVTSLEDVFLKARSTPLSPSSTPPPVPPSSSSPTPLILSNSCVSSALLLLSSSLLSPLPGGGGRNGETVGRIQHERRYRHRFIAKIPSHAFLADAGHHLAQANLRVQRPFHHARPRRLAHRRGHCRRHSL